MTKFLLFIFLLSSMSAKSIQAMSKSVSLSGNNLVVLKDDVSLFYENYTLFSNHLEANKKDRSVFLSGGVTALSQKLLVYAKEIKLCKEEIDFKNMFAIEPDSKTWIKTTKAKKQKSKYIINDFVVSSCDIKNPTWKIYVKDGVYDTNNSFLTLKNSYLLLGDVKVMYIPYITFPLNKKRKSGLLRPRFGLSNSDGFLYFQPIFVALAKNYDIEFTPQFRSSRGVGLFSKFRFVDTNDSKGYIRAGYFENKNSYVEKNSLQHTHHQGLEFYYKNESLSNFDSFKDKFLIDYKTLNDIDYINLQSSKNDYVIDKLVSSKVNYIAYDENNYFGTYLKYFKDTSKSSNDDTFQTVPSFQYHRFENTFFANNFLYSLDLKATNLYRKEGVNAREFEFNLPFVYTNSFLNDYLNLSVSQNLFLDQVNYYNRTTSAKKARLLRSYFQFNLASDLVKKYETLFHTVHFNLDFIVPNYKKQSGVFEDFLKLNTEEKSLNLEAIQFFYKNGENFLTHRINQTYYFERANEEGDLVNEIEVNLNKFDFSNKVTYSYIYNSVTQVQSTLEYEQNNFKIDLLHTYSDSPLEIKSNFFSLKAQRDVSDLYKIFSNVEYDYENRFFKSAKVGWKMEKRCLKYNIYYKYELTPDASQSGTLREHGIYFDFELTPLGSLRYYYSRDSRGFENEE